MYIRTQHLRHSANQPLSTTQMPLKLTDVRFPPYPPPPISATTVKAQTDKSPIFISSVINNVVSDQAWSNLTEGSKLTSKFFGRFNFGQNKYPKMNTSEQIKFSNVEINIQTFITEKFSLRFIDQGLQLCAQNA